MNPVGDGAREPDRYVLRLFVAGMTARSQRTIANLRAICLAHLGDRVDLHPLAAALDAPPAVLDAHAGALDLDDDHPDVRHEDDEVGLVVLAAVGEAEVGDDRVLRAEGVPQLLPHDLLGLGREARVLRDQQRRHVAKVPIRRRAPRRRGRR